MIAEQSTSPITAIRLKPEYPRPANLGLSCEFFVVRPIWRPDALRRDELAILLTCHHYGGMCLSMEKRKPTYDLAAIKAAIGAAETLSITSSALRDAVGLGFDRGGIAKVIRTIARHMFYKSMTTHADHRVWQDVYHVPVENGPTLYVKFQANVVTEFTVMSFKEK
jgi:motility quorum-sensing regulator / GCU-specific mRNA interferase toxin